MAIVSGSMALEKNTGKLRHPCLHPLKSEKASDITPSVKI